MTRQMQQRSPGPNSVRRRWLRRVGMFVGGIVSIVSLLLVIGGYLPAIPYLGAYGSVVLSLWPAWLIVAALVSSTLVWRAGTGAIRVLLIAADALAALGAGYAIHRVLAVAQANNVTVAFGAPFGFTGALAEVAPDEEIPYAHDGGEALSLRIYRPRGAPPRDGWPVLLYVHGGGWTSGSSAQRSADMRWFADHGWITVSIGYGLSSDNRHLWNRVHGQIGCAMAWSATQLVVRDGDIRRLAMFGDSAGGNLVLNAAYMANAGTLSSTCGGKVPRVAAVSATYPGVDLAAIYRNNYRPTGPQVQAMVSRYTGGTPSQYPDRYVATASATYIHAAAPPTLLFISESDHLVPPESIRRFEARIRAAHIQTRTISVPFAEHVFDATGIGNTIVRQATLRFIDKNAPDLTPASRRARPSTNPSKFEKDKT
jgi:acetyl esterase